MILFILVPLQHYSKLGLLKAIRKYRESNAPRDVPIIMTVIKRIIFTVFRVIFSIVRIKLFNICSYN